MIGVGRLVFDAVDAKSGEFSILVHDDYQRKGVATRVTNALIEAAIQRRIEEIHGDVLEHNPAMTTFAQGIGFEIRPGRDEGLKTIAMRI